MKKSFWQKAVALLLCVVMVAGPAAPVMAEEVAATEDVTMIDEIAQESDVGEILVFGGENTIPICIVQGDVPIVVDSEYTCWSITFRRNITWHLAIWKH